MIESHFKQAAQKIAGKSRRRRPNRLSKSYILPPDEDSAESKRKRKSALEGMDAAADGVSNQQTPERYGRRVRKSALDLLLLAGRLSGED